LPSDGVAAVRAGPHPRGLVGTGLEPQTIVRAGRAMLVRGSRTIRLDGHCRPRRGLRARMLRVPHGLPARCRVDGPLHPWSRQVRSRILPARNRRVGARCAPNRSAIPPDLVMRERGVERCVEAPSSRPGSLTAAPRTFAFRAGQVSSVILSRAASGRSGSSRSGRLRGTQDGPPRRGRDSRALGSHRQFAPLLAPIQLREPAVPTDPGRGQGDSLVRRIVREDEIGTRSRHRGMLFRDVGTSALRTPLVEPHESTPPHPTPSSARTYRASTGMRLPLSR